MIQSLVAFSLGANFDNSYIGIPALGRLGAPYDIALELSERARSLLDYEFEAQAHNFDQVVKELQDLRVVNLLFEQWRVSLPDSAVRRRFQGLLAAVDKPLLNEGLERIRSSASDPDRP